MLYPCGIRTHDYKFTYDDYQMYEYRLKCFLDQPKARAAIMRGGIVWRIALEVLGEDGIAAACKGPSTNVYEYSEAFRPPYGEDWYDDVLSRDELDAICGMYKVYDEEFTTFAEVSWWPRDHTWSESPMDHGRWTPHNEVWFAVRLNHIRSNECRLHSSKRWRSSLRVGPNSSTFKRALEVGASRFLRQELGIVNQDVAE
ncbi:hypothetical protein L227DRAFT_589669 [Lentinus tigrinus ALCF2SS1-6]|uniref:Uncharacterized protein n=1 Tax=Lentinus tigrinus ALCF2SS1-6 TaxID=1328759 RepID=A0A5C2RME6_9APHY|nr:hypothetical protein L227DRAFT_589669 [Lentinus tigrinus ALCF2SS1-6]